MKKKEIDLKSKKDAKSKLLLVVSRPNKERETLTTPMVVGRPPGVFTALEKSKIPGAMRASGLSGSLSPV